MNISKALAGGCIAALLTTTSANAAAWQLLDHGDGNLGEYYGLRYDSLLNNGPEDVFSASSGGADVSLIWNGDFGADAIAVIKGTLAYNLDADTPAGSDGAPDGAISTVHYTLKGLTAGGVFGFMAASGSGTICGGIFGGPTDCETMNGEAMGGSGPVFKFFADGHRIGDDSLVARGWLLPTSSTDDWLVRAATIPLPAAAWLLIGGIGALGAVRARRKAA